MGNTASDGNNQRGSANCNFFAMLNPYFVFNPIVLLHNLFFIYLANSDYKQKAHPPVPAPRVTAQLPQSKFFLDKAKDLSIWYR